MGSTTSRDSSHSSQSTTSGSRSRSNGTSVHRTDPTCATVDSDSPVTAAAFRFNTACVMKCPSDPAGARNENGLRVGGHDVERVLLQIRTNGQDLETEFSQCASSHLRSAFSARLLAGNGPRTGPDVGERFANHWPLESGSTCAPREILTCPGA